VTVSKTSEQSQPDYSSHIHTHKVSNLRKHNSLKHAHKFYNFTFQIFIPLVLSFCFANHAIVCQGFTIFKAWEHTHTHIMCIIQNELEEIENDSRRKLVMLMAKGNKYLTMRKNLQCWTSFYACMDSYRPLIMKRNKFFFRSSSTSSVKNYNSLFYLFWGSEIERREREIMKKLTNYPKFNKYWFRRMRGYLTFV
jgi:hypothetical protein